jgi:hypothetical protein
MDLGAVDLALSLTYSALLVLLLAVSYVALSRRNRRS